MKNRPFVTVILAILFLAGSILIHAAITPSATDAARATEPVVEPIDDIDDIDDMTEMGHHCVARTPAEKIAIEVELLKAVDDLGLSKEQTESLAAIGRKLSDEVAQSRDVILQQLTIEKQELLAGPAGDAVREGEKRIGEEKAAIRNALLSAKQDALNILSPEQRNKAMKIASELQIPSEVCVRALSLGPRMLKALSDLLDQKLANM